MIEYRSLENVEIEMLHNTFIEAFSDYQVDVNLSIANFKNMLKRNGYLNRASIGAFDDGKLVGFLLIGMRNWNGKKTAYDLGTAVIKEYRNQGITSNMFLENKKKIIEMGCQQYLLEAIQNNNKAVNLYKKQGFKILRKFDCFKMKKSECTVDLKNTYNTKEFDILNRNNMSELKSLMEFETSWQNSIDSIMAIHQKFICLGVYDNEKLIAYGIIEKATGDIVQMAVNKDYRGKGIGTNIINDLVKSCGSKMLSVINVDSECESMRCFLEELGFECYIKQYEMILKF